MKNPTRSVISEALTFGYHTAKDEEKGIRSQGYETRFMERFLSFELCLITNFKWNGCGWVTNNDKPSIVRDTQDIYNEYTAKINHNSF